MSPSPFAEWLESLTPEQKQIKAYGEDAVRLSDIVRGAIEAGYGNRGWIAFRLDNGASNDHIYESRKDAVADSQTHLELAGSRCGYVKIPHDDMPPRDARHFIDLNRKLDDAGFRITDPEDGDRAPIVSHRREAV